MSTFGGQTHEFIAISARRYFHRPVEISVTKIVNMIWITVFFNLIISKSDYTQLIIVVDYDTYDDNSWENEN